MTQKKESALERYRKTYSGTALLGKYTLSTVGLWRIRGEDPNCDFGGHHYQPELGVVEGTLADVIDYAVGLKNFWTWGGGGDISLVEVKKIDSAQNKRDAELRAEAEALHARLIEINKELGA